MEESEPIVKEYEVERFEVSVSVVSVDDVEYVTTNNAPNYLGMTKYAGEQVLARYLKAQKIKRWEIPGAGGNAKYYKCEDLKMIRREVFTPKTID